MDTLLLTKLVATLILPPGGILVLLALGLVMRPWRPRLGMTLVLAGAISLYLLSTGAVATLLMVGLERERPLTPAVLAASGAEAIVVLGGGRRPYAPEYGGETVSSGSLERIRYAAFLQRVTGLPLAVTGGSVFGDGAPEAVLMAQVLENEFRVPVRWVEVESRNTEQNAIFTRHLLERDGVQSIVLVSHASHLSRATPMFRAEGFQVVEAPTGFMVVPDEDITWRDWLPSDGALGVSWFALHERLGRLWYELKRRWALTF